MSVAMKWNGDYANRTIRARFQQVLTDRIVPDFLKVLVPRTPIRTGKLRKGWRVVPDAQRVRVVVRNDVFYAVFQEYRRGMLRQTLDEFAPVLQAELERARQSL